MNNPMHEEALLLMIASLFSGGKSKSIELEKGMNFLLQLHTLSTFLVLNQLDLPKGSPDSVSDKGILLQLFHQLQSRTENDIKIYLDTLLESRSKQAANDFLSTILNKETN